MGRKPKTPRKTGKIAPIRDNPAQELNQTPTEGDPAETTDSDEPEQPAETEGKQQIKGRHRDPLPKHRDFFERCAKIPRADWGTRASIRIYRLEPLINRLHGSGNKYITIYDEPITEEKIKIDHGSGRYRLYLNYKAPAKPREELDSIEIDILDMNFPPKVPKGEWIEDPRNKVWAWARPNPAPEAAITPQATLENAYETVLDIQDRERERMKPANPEPQQSPIQLAKDILEIQNGSNNPLVQMFMTQINLLAAEIKDSRAREADLQKELRAGAQQPARPNISPLVQMKELATELKELFPLFKGMLPEAAEAVHTVSRGPRRSFFEELTLSTAPHLLDFLQPISAAIGARLMAGPVGPQVQRPQNGQHQAIQAAPANGQAQPQPQAQQNTAETRVIGFLQQSFVWSTLKAYVSDFIRGGTDHPDGTGFAEWIAEGQPTILTDARSVGSERLLAIIKTAPEWTQMQPYEAKVLEFIDQVLSWQPEPQEPEADADVTDLTGGAPLNRAS